ncbi:MAG: glycosyltransferase family 4 protein [Limisphaerales bacterium]
MPRDAHFPLTRLSRHNTLDGVYLASMKIALCLEYPIDQLGGVEVLVSELILGLGQRNQIILVSPDDAASLARSRVAPLVSEHIPFLRGQTSVANARALAEKIAQARPDLAHFHFGNYGFGNRFPFHSPIFYLHRRNVPCVTTSHLVVSIFDGYCGSERPFWAKLLMLPLAWYGKMQQLRHVYREIAVSQNDLKKLRAWYRPLRGRFMQIYHSRLREEPRGREGEKRQPVILNVGHVAWRKGQLVLAEAFAQIASRFPEWTLQLAGPDQDRVIMEKICNLIREQQLEGRIKLLGKRDDAPALMRQAAIYVQPSFFEGMPLSLQEAMFHGCAAIASRIGAHEELIHENKTGLLFKPGDVPQLARALEQLISNHQQRETLARPPPLPSGSAK